MRRSEVNLGYNLELPCHHLCMLLGFCSSEHAGTHRWEMENRVSPFGADVLGGNRPRDDYNVGVEAMVWGTCIGRYLWRSVVSLEFYLLSGFKHFNVLLMYPIGFGWTQTHGYFIQMGGFMLHKGDVPQGVLSPEKMKELLAKGEIEFPTITEKQIQDRSKGDGLAKTLLVLQTMWFIAHCIARKAQGLDTTEIELVTLAFAVLNVAMYVVWWNKPLDAQSYEVVHLLDPPLHLTKVKGSTIER